MNKVYSELAQWGCNIEIAMERFLNDEDLYTVCLNEVIRDTAFEDLGKAISDKDVSAAFECAHTLKGVLANMELTPMLTYIDEILQPLRNGRMDNLNSIYGELMKAKDKLSNIINNT
ncbi:MAG: Hpt domain-containing protein [Oscillospiraceae bacterium]